MQFNNPRYAAPNEKAVLAEDGDVSRAFLKIPDGTPKSEWDQWPRESRLFAESGLTPAPWSDTRTQEQLFAELRVQRNKLLSESDWTQLPDAQVNAAAWVTYRQALRDLPANTADPANPVWPAKP